MADELRMALAEVLRKAGVEEADFLREGVRVLAQELMELELAEHVGAERHERTLERSGYRNGYRERPWDTRVAPLSCRCRGYVMAAFSSSSSSSLQACRS